MLSSMQPVFVIWVYSAHILGCGSVGSLCAQVLLVWDTELCV